MPTPPPPPFWEKNLTPTSSFSWINRTPTSNPFVKAGGEGGIHLWVIKTTCFSSLLIKPVITKSVNLKFENVSFTKLHKRSFMIIHVTNQVINLRWWKCNNLFKPLIRENIKYIQFKQIFNCTHNKNEIKESPKIKLKTKGTSYETEIWKTISQQSISISVHYWRAFPLGRIQNSKSASIQFSERVAKIYFLMNLQSRNTLSYSAQFLIDIFS